MSLRVFHALQRAHTGLFRAAERLLTAEFDVTAAQLGLVFALQRHDGAPIAAVARELALAPSSMSGLVDRAVARGLVRREPNPEDARSHRLRLEPAGWDLADRAGARVALINRRLLQGYSPEERAAIARFLNDMATNADALVGGATTRRRA